MSDAQRHASLPDAAPTVLENGQRRAVLVMYGAGLAMLAVGLLVPPAGALYWVALLVAPVLGGGLGGLLSGSFGRRLDAWLLSGGAVAQRPAGRAPLAEPARAALQAAMVPAMLADLGRAAEAWPAREKDAARALLAAALGPAAMARETREALGRDLPRVIASLAARDASAAGEAEALAARLAAAGGAAR
ncbi:hypothetical protein GXW74_12885 [Roseomonas eburnea]|uniref:Uncharacterized protein n=1 Tax=Neoroseomonas eburnea TaxID=1346889 RepID=A0A9X9XCE8_9PROT|nr:hypothetical protein [Neoroseomonas eburnea]MBR0681384.1 hypothetical protein [Neoroseomonas eburnea]